MVINKKGQPCLGYDPKYDHIQEKRKKKTRFEARISTHTPQHEQCILGIWRGMCSNLSNTCWWPELKVKLILPVLSVVSTSTLEPSKPPSSGQTLPSLTWALGRPVCGLPPVLAGRGACHGPVRFLPALLGRDNQEFLSPSQYPLLSGAQWKL